MISPKSVSHLEAVRWPTSCDTAPMLAGPRSLEAFGSSVSLIGLVHTTPSTSVSSSSRTVPSAASCLLGSRMGLCGHTEHVKAEKATSADVNRGKLDGLQQLLLKMFEWDEASKNSQLRLPLVAFSKRRIKRQRSDGFSFHRGTRHPCF